jgi:hypothetical protein
MLRGQGIRLPWKAICVEPLEETQLKEYLA